MKQRNNVRLYKTEEWLTVVPDGGITYDCINQWNNVRFYEMEE